MQHGEGPVLDIRGLSVGYATSRGLARAVDEFSLEVAPAEFVGLAGESGCGKSTVAHAALRLLRPPGVITGGQIFIDGQDVLSMTVRRLRQVRWNHAAIVLQNSLTALDPVQRIGRQFEAVLRKHGGVSREKARVRARSLLTDVDLDAAVLRAFPHELSGGMRQRVVIAMAMALSPSLLIMDEPTTALDVIVQHSILETVKALQSTRRFSVLFITHDLPLLLTYADRVAIMRSGGICEVAASTQLAAGAQHPYSRQLLASIPRIGDRAAVTGGAPRD